MALQSSLSSQLFFEKQQQSLSTLTTMFLSAEMPYCLRCPLNFTAESKLISRYMQHCILQFSLDFLKYNCFLFYQLASGVCSGEVDATELPTKKISLEIP